MVWIIIAVVAVALLVYAWRSSGPGKGRGVNQGSVDETRRNSQSKGFYSGG